MVYIYTKKLFDRHDVDGNGVLEGDEVVKMAEFLKIDLKEVNLDSIAYEDFEKLLINVGYINHSISELSLDYIIESFYQLDYDGDGCISINDIHLSFLSIGMNVDDNETLLAHSKLDIYKTGCPSLNHFIECVTR